MKCQVCKEYYDKFIRIPKNLCCGHTFCENCLTEFVEENMVICPKCMKKSQCPLPISYGILDSMSTDNNLKNLEHCVYHPEEKLEYYCQTDDRNICCLCILETHLNHSIKTGKSNLPIVDLKNTTFDTTIKTFQAFQLELENAQLRLDNNYSSEKEKIGKFVEIYVNSKKDKIDSIISIIEQNYQKNINHLKTYIDGLTAKIEELKYHNEFIEEAFQNQSKNIAKISKINIIKEEEEFRLFKYSLDHSNLLDEIRIDDYYLNYNQAQLKNEITQFIDNSVNDENEKNVNSVIFFGDAKTKMIMEFNLENFEWSLMDHKNSQIFEFNDYCASAKFSNGDILISGGCIYTNFRNTAKKTVYKLKIDDGKLIFTHFKNLINSRFSHGLSIIKDIPYVFGGHNGNETLSSLERFNLHNKKWELMSSMHIEREIFAHCNIKERYIFVFGGFNFIHLDSIERYDTLHNKWKILNIKMKRPLQNATAVKISDEKIMLIGGYNGALHKCVDILDLTNNNWISVSFMEFPRRKCHAFKHKKKIFVFGGENNDIDSHTPEYYDMETKTWNRFKSYDHLVKKSLSFWSSSQALL